jgi:hypothetical protein
MFEASIEHRYKYDITFRHVVDILRSELSLYNITPGELRQAAMLAATMHEAERIRPLIFTPIRGMAFDKITVDEWKTPPAMFGGDTYAADQHRHIFYFSGHGYNVCDCGISDVYYNSDLYAFKVKN